jgi:hypothetical protein
VYDLPAEDYHADPVPGGSLSSSGARLLLPPGCPAIYRWQADHPQPPNRTFDFGHVAHRQVLGVGPDVVVIDAEDYRRTAARAARDEAYAAGAVPLLATEHEQVLAMEAVLRAHPVAGPLFDPSKGGVPEHSLFWHDDGVWRRAMLDWYRPAGPGRRLIIADYKTCRSADPGELGRAMASFGYDLKAGWYRDGAAALGLAGAEDLDPAFVLVCQAKDPPYLITVGQPDHIALRYAEAMNRKALDIYRACVRTGVWPGHVPDEKPVSLALPGWVARQRELALALELGEYEVEGQMSR